MTKSMFRSFARVVALPLLWCAAWSAQAQTEPVCGPDKKEEVVKILSNTKGMSEGDILQLQAKVYEEFKFCAQDGAAMPPSDPYFVAVKQCGARPTYVGSLFYEEMPCCGYDPQRRAFTCPVKIKQTFGFGAQPNPGSREYVLHCVVDPATGAMLPVGQDSVHLANTNANSPPPWQFGVLAHAVRNLQTVQPMNGAPRRARSILSWNLVPTDCNYQPIWGNVIDYRIRLDQ